MNDLFSEIEAEEMDQPASEAPPKEEERAELTAPAKPAKKKQRHVSMGTLAKMYVDQLMVGEMVDSYFVVHRCNLREFEKGSETRQFLTLRLGDRTGKVDAVLWNDAEQASHQVKEGRVVRVAGKVDTYKNEMQIRLDHIEPIADEQSIDATAFLPESPIPYEELTARFDRIIDEMSDPHCQALLRAFREDETIWKRFSNAPGAKMWHHPYLHGLLEHTLSVVDVARFIGNHYEGVNEDLLITGAVFHDCGKMDEFGYDYRIDYTTDGRLMGHVFMGAMWLERLIDRLPDFPAEKRRLLIHMVLSHHGERDKGAPVVPMTLEACLLHHIENMDAQIAAFQREMDKVADPQTEWTGFVNLIERQLYRGKPSS